MKKQEKEFKPIRAAELRELLASVRPEATVQFETPIGVMFCVGATFFSNQGHDSVILRSANLPMRNVLGENVKTYEDVYKNLKNKKGVKNV